MNYSHGHKAGGVASPTYKSWESMWSRCRNENNIGFERYRDLDIQDSWKDFRNFLVDMGVRPEGKTLDRKNNDLGYSKDNCRWATPTEQQRNRRSVQTNSSTGIKGVSVKSGKYYTAYYPDGRRSVHLGSSTNFFEACCIRKSWEAKHGKGY